VSYTEEVNGVGTDAQFPAVDKSCELAVPHRCFERLDLWIVSQEGSVLPLARAGLLCLVSACGISI